MKRKLGFIALSIALLAFGAAIIIHPERYVACCLQGFAMWAECILPSLFPFMVITLIFVKTGIAQKASLPLKRVTDKFKLPSATASLYLLSICSGYPAGSRVVGEFCDNGIIARDDCPKVAYLCSTSGPLFIVGSVGFKMLGDRTAGFKILLCHILAVTAVSLVISLLSKRAKYSVTPRISPSNNLLYDCFYSAVISVAVCGGFIAFFFVVANFCSDFNLLLPFEFLLKWIFGENVSSALSLGLIEATTGCRALASSGGRISTALCGFLVTFGGVSILLQQLCYLTKAGVKPLKFIAVKFIQAVICFGLLLLIA